MAPAAKAKEPGQASFTVYTAEETWRALRRYADDNDVTRSSVIEAALELQLSGGNADVLARAQEITAQGRQRSV